MWIPQLKGAPESCLFSEISCIIEIRASFLPLWRLLWWAFLIRTLWCTNGICSWQLPSQHMFSLSFIHLTCQPSFPLWLCLKCCPTHPSITERKFDTRGGNISSYSLVWRACWLFLKIAQSAVLRTLVLCRGNQGFFSDEMQIVHSLSPISENLILPWIVTQAPTNQLRRWDDTALTSH